MAPRANAAQQLRRLWIDLVGLPPTPAALLRFTEQPSDANYNRCVDELLASPHFGERWARHWLDLVRYSETLGHEFDYELPNAWRYRDYVIRAFNQDLPYDQFVREHIAGDLLPEPRRDQDGNNESVQATGSWWFVEQSHSPVDVMQQQADRVDNQIDVFGKAFLGMTVACARCHDHKFDAIPTRDYYSLFGYVQSSHYVQASMREIAPSSAPYQLALTRQRELAATWLQPAQIAQAATANALANGVHYRDEDVVIADTSDPDSLWYLSNDGFGDQPWRGPFCANPDHKEPLLRQLPGAFWLSATAGTRREGTVATKTFALEHRYVHVRVAGEHSRVKLIVDGFYLTRDPIYGGLHRDINNPQAHWLTFDVSMWLGHHAHLMAIDQRAPDLADPRHNRGSYPEHGWIAIQSVSSSPHHHAPPSEDVPGVVVADAARTSAAWRQQRLQLCEAIAALPVADTVPALADGSGRDSYVYLRGDPHQASEVAPRHFLSALDASTQPLPTTTSGRLQLAAAVLAKDNPLPARVLVNRLWHHLFGRGIVKSVDNFGALGDPPSHPELLDWLARDFVAHGWSMQHSIRRIVTADAYRQSSQIDTANGEQTASHDPDNLLLHRQNVKPLEAEVLRDALLAISGRLDPKLYGPSIQPPREAVTDARGKPDRYDPSDGRGRRSIYLAVRRNFLPEWLLAFDLPTPFATVGRRNTSNVPAQALALLNSPLVHDLCASFAKRVLAHSQDAEARLQFAFQLALARFPRHDEQEQLLRFVDQAGEPLQHWTDAMHALINTTEFRFCR